MPVLRISRRGKSNPDSCVHYSNVAIAFQLADAVLALKHHQGNIMLGITDTATITISITGIEIIALEKLSLVSHVLAEKIGGSSGQEQLCLVRTLDDVLRRIKIQASKPA